jgi:3-oxoacyl-[acyl-carrier-protein] synthase II
MAPVLVTGCGVTCGLGNDIETLWSGLLSGTSSVVALDMPTSFRSRIASLVDEKGLYKHNDKRLVPFKEPSINYALHAAHQAIEQSRLIERGIDPSRIGVIISTGIGGVATIEQQHALLLERGPSRISPYFVPNAIHNTPAGLVSMLYGFKGMTCSVSSACSSSTQAIGIAMRLIQSGDLHACVVGGTEHGVTPCGLAGFGAQRALSTRNDSPKEACRPWDRDRDGFVMGNGAAVMVLERQGLSGVDQIVPYGEIADIGWTSDAYHPVQPDPEGHGAMISMQRAMKTLNNINEVGYINAHATGTPIGDLIEPSIMKILWPDHYNNMYISSTKSMHGHLLGAAGALEAIITLLSLKHQIVPPTINCPNPEISDIHFVNHGALGHKMRYALSNSFGFGGTNATILCKSL